jgi:hypothetical protein
MNKLQKMFPGLTLFDWMLAALFTGYLSIVAGIGMLYFAQKRREERAKEEINY